MEELKKRVAAFQSRWNVTRTVQVDFYTSSLGQHYAILVTKGIWYKVRLFVEQDHPNCPSIPLYENLPNGTRTRREQVDLTENEHLTLNGVKERIENFHEFFKKPDFQAACQIMYQTGFFEPYFMRAVPKDYASNPEKYLQRGDIIATPFVKVALHTAIYLGNGKVSHVSGHGEGKAKGWARIGRLIGDFTTKGTEKISIVNLPLRIRTGEEIAKKAEELAANKFRDGDYNILLRNCQHFVFLCATGVEFAINI